MVTVKFLCSYAGKIVPRFPDGKLRYVGGETRVLSVDRSISFTELLMKLGDLCGAPVSSLRCQLPTDDLDALVSVTSDEDLENLIEEYDRASSPESNLKIRAFISPPKSKLARKISSSSSSSSASTNYFAGSASKAPPASFRLGKISSQNQNLYQYHHQHHHHRYGCYAHGSSSSSHAFLVHNGNHCQ